MRTLPAIARRAGTWVEQSTGWAELRAPLPVTALPVLCPREPTLPPLPTVPLPAGSADRTCRQHISRHCPIAGGAAHARGGAAPWQQLQA